VWIALLIGTTDAGAAVGLLLGGVLADHASVAAVFWVMFESAAILFAAVAVFVPESSVGAPTRPNWVGGVLFTGSLVMVLLTISEGNAWSWSSPEVVSLIVASVILLIALVVFERRCTAPMVDVRRLGRRSAWSANLAAFAIVCGLFVAGVLIPRIATLPAASGYGLASPRPDQPRLEACEIIY